MTILRKGATALLVCLFSCALATTSFAGTKMPSFSLASAQTGKMISSSQFAGKARLVVFFATWCMPCMQEVPALMSLQDEYGQDNFTVVAISVDRRLNDVKNFMNRAQVNYPVLLADRRVVNAFGGIPGLPTSFLVDSKGTVLKKYPGLVPHALLEREVKRLIP